MTAVKEALIQRFGANRVLDIPTKEGEMPLLALDFELKTPITVIMTNGLSDYTMPVPETYKGYEHNELCFCLPSYWEWEAVDNPQTNWIYDWLQKLSKHVVEKKTWFGHGHTIPNGKGTLLPFSSTMLEDHLLLSSPLKLEQELQVLELSDKKVHFLTIIPIFSDEMDFKQHKGTYKFIQKFIQKRCNEILDDYRKTIMKSKWRIF